MPRLSPYELNKQLDAEDESQTIERDEALDIDYEDMVLFGELSETDISKPDTVKVLGMVVEPYVGKVFDQMSDFVPTVRYRYQIGVLDTESNQKYVLEMYQHYYESGESTPIFKLKEMDEDLEYTHKPKEELFIHGFSITPHKYGPRWHQSSFQKLDEEDMAEDDEGMYDEERKDRIVKINDELYRVHSLSSNQIENNVFHCTMNCEWEDYGHFFVREQLFEILPEMKEKFKEQVRTIELSVDYRSDRKRLEQTKAAFRAHEDNEKKRKKAERAKARAEIKMYEENRKGRRKTSLDEVVINRLKAKQKQK